MQKHIWKIIWLFAVFMSLPALSAAKTAADQKFRGIEPFTRIISLCGAHTENLFALGLDKEIIGVSQIEAHLPETLTKPVFTYHDDAEKFMGARPDLVLIRPMIAMAHGAFVTKLRKAGITVVSIQPVNIDEMYHYWKTLGTLTARENNADEMIFSFQKAVGFVRSLIQPIPPEKRKRVYFEAIHEKMKTFSPGAIAIFALTTAGGINITKDAKPRRNTNIATYGKEQILARSGEIDVYLAQKGRMNPTSVEIIRQEPGFHIIKAVKNGQIYLIDEVIVSRPGLRLVQGIFEIGKALYPDIFTAEVWEKLSSMSLINGK